MKLDNIRVLAHSAIRIAGEKTVYFDPFSVKEEFHDADVVFVTHDHYDHFSPEDMKKVSRDETVFVMPVSTVSLAVEAGFPLEKLVAVEPGEAYEAAGLSFTAVPAYNVGKKFHTRDKNWVGYLVTMDGLRYYVAGDTDANEDVLKVSCDVALLPVGGKYTMNAEEAAALARALKPQAAIPTHFGSIVGSPEDGKRFAELLRGEIEAVLR